MRPDLSPLVLMLGLLLLACAICTILALLLTLTGDSLGSVRCWRRGNHDPYRHPVGGFRCRDCRAAGATLHDLGFEGLHYVTPPAIREHLASVRDTGRTSPALRPSACPPGWDPNFLRPERRPS